MVHTKNVHDFRNFCAQRERQTPGKHFWRKKY